MTKEDALYVVVDDSEDPDADGAAEADADDAGAGARDTVDDEEQ